jgi:hypothetical protein
MEGSLATNAESPTPEFIEKQATLSNTMAGPSTRRATPSTRVAKGKEKVIEREIRSAADISRIREQGQVLSAQEIKELNARLRALQEMQRIEKQFQELERQRQVPDLESLRSSEVSPSAQPRTQESQSEYRRRPTSVPGFTPMESEEERDFRPYKRSRLIKGVKITPSYTLRVTSSLREWGDWKRDVERVFKADPYTYQDDELKILKALDYVDQGMKSLWYTFSDQSFEDIYWNTFVDWTKDNIQNGQNNTTTLYEQYREAVQRINQSPAKFNAYLSSIERDLPIQDEATSAMNFYSRLSPELRKQFKTADVQIPATRAKCVAVAQRIWEGLNFDDKPRNPIQSSGGRDSKRFPRDWKQRDGNERDSRNWWSRRNTGNPRRDNTNEQDNYQKEDRHRHEKDLKDPKEREAKSERKCYTCGQPGHFAPECPKKEWKDRGRERHRDKTSKVQEVKTRGESNASSRTISRASSISLYSDNLDSEN